MNPDVRMLARWLVPWSIGRSIGWLVRRNSLKSYTSIAPIGALVHVSSEKMGPLLIGICSWTRNENFRRKNKNNKYNQQVYFSMQIFLHG